MATRSQTAGKATKSAKKSVTRAASPAPVRARICIDFSSYPDNTPLGPTYVQGGFTFKQLAPSPVMFANATAGQIGLQFPDGGLDVRFPAPTRRATLIFGTFGGAVTIEARMGALVVSSQTVNTNNTFQNIVINNATPFARFVFRGGRNEAILVRICVDLLICEVDGRRPKSR
jgi:hypothetical protein